MPERYFFIDEAATRLNMSIRALRAHIYTQKDLKADGVKQGRLLFRESTLALFFHNKRSRGRPTQKGSLDESQSPCLIQNETPGGDG